MALKNAQLNISLDRGNFTFEVLSTSTAICTNDENIAVSVSGFTTEELALTNNKTPYEPVLRIYGLYNKNLIAEATLAPSGENMVGTLSTNTAEFLAECAIWPAGSVNYLAAYIESTTSANPIASGVIEVTKVVAATDGNNNPLPSAANVATIELSLANHTSATNNPHGVTAAQVGAYSTAGADATFATKTQIQQLQSQLATANDTISSLQSALQTANLSIANNTLALSGKANVANTYRKDETYNKSEVDALMLAHTKILTGKNYKTPETINEAIALVVRLVNALGGTTSTNVSAQDYDAPTAIAIADTSGTNHSITIATNELGEKVLELE